MLRITLQSYSTICVFTQSHKNISGFHMCKRDTKNVTKWAPNLLNYPNAHWSHAWVNQCGLHNRNKILPRSAQILFVIGTAFAVHSLQCMWMHVVQITNPIRKRIAIRNGFRNVIHSLVNRPIVLSVSGSREDHSLVCPLWGSDWGFLILFLWQRA